MLFPRSVSIWFFVPSTGGDVFDGTMLRFCADTMRKVCVDFGAELAEFSGLAPKK